MIGTSQFLKYFLNVLGKSINSIPLLMKGILIQEISRNATSRLKWHYFIMHNY